MKIGFIMWVALATTSCVNPPMPVEKQKMMVVTDVSPKAETSRQQSIPFERSVVKIGDRLALFNLEDSTLAHELNCDACIFRVEKIYGTKNMGVFALGAFDMDSNSEPYTLELYYWDSKRGYRQSRLYRWPRRLTKPEGEIEDGFWSLPFEPMFVDDGITFQIVKV